MAAQRDLHTASLLPGGKILMVGGHYSKYELYSY
jgi:hypothetical protein